MKDTLYLIDGYSLIYRSYYAFKNRPLRNSKGENTSAIFGFFNSLFQLIDLCQPKYLAVIMDSLTPTFRHKKFKAYKAKREKTPEDLHAQIPRIEEMLTALNIPFLRHDGYEADDIIATLIKKCDTVNMACNILTKDKDLLQMVIGDVKILYPEKGTLPFSEWSRQQVFEHMGVYPEQIIDFLALAGDQSDNIPGVPGVGVKTAVKLLANYSNLDNIYESIDKITPVSLQNRLLEGKESAFLSKELVILKSDIPVQDPQQLKLSPPNIKEAIKLFEKEGMKKLITRIGGQSELDNSYDRIAPGAYPSITTVKDLDEWIEKVKTSRLFAFDTETDSLDDMQARPVGFSLSVAKGDACYIPLKALGVECIAEETIKQKLNIILSDTNLKLVGQNIKYDYKVMKRWGITIKNVYFDTMIAAWLLDNVGMSRYGLDQLAEKYLRYKTIKYTDIVDTKNNQTIAQVKLEKVADYSGEDADITLRLYQKFENLIKQQKLEQVFYSVEMPILPILAEMELIGIRVNASVLNEKSRQLGIKLDELEKNIWHLCGEEFNINSPKQLRYILFDKQKYLPVKGKKTKSGHSTDAQVLRILAATERGQVPALILDHRRLAKLKNTYLDTIPQLINQHTGRIHTTFLQTGTATGRLASKDPNLQNIPVREEEGREIRHAFIPAAGYVFLSADYSQIELVILAQLCRDQLLMQALKQGVDIHKQTAAVIFDIPFAQVGTEERRVGKTINYGVIYGISAFRLSRELKISRQRADDFIKTYFQRFTGVNNYKEKTIQFAEQNGYVKTLMGRKRMITEINSSNQTLKNTAQRIAVNTTIQGSAADIVKLAMLDVYKKMKQQNLKSMIILQVHDELIFEVPRDEVEIVKAIVKKIMENTGNLILPLKVTIEVGESWGAIH